MFLQIVGWMCLVGLSLWVSVQGCGLYVLAQAFYGRVSKFAIILIATGIMLVFFSIRAAPFHVSLTHA